MLTINLPREVEARLSKFIAEHGQSTDILISAAIMEYLDEQEDIAIAEQRLSNPAKRISMNDVVKKLGLAH